APRLERRRPRSSPVDISNSRQPHHILPPSLNEPLHGGNVPVTRRACVGLALLSLRVTSGLPKPPLLPRHSIYVLKQTACRPAALFKKPVPERPQRLAVKPSSAPALRVQVSSFLYQSRPKLFRP